MYRGYKVRIFPTPEQANELKKHNDAKRALWNYLIALQEGRYKQRGLGVMSSFTMAKEIKLLKLQPEYFWLNEVSARTLCQVCRDLEEAYKLYFRKIHGIPKYKKKKDDNVHFPLGDRGTETYFVDDEFIKIPKLEKLRYTSDFSLPKGYGQKLYNPRLSYDKASEKWFVAFSLKCEKQAVELTGKSVGIDLGVKELAVVAIDDKKLVFHNINKSKRMRAIEKKKRYIRKTISRKYRTYNKTGTLKKGEQWEKSKNIEKYEQIFRRLCAKQANIRKNYIHHITRQLVDMLPNKITMEDLNVTAMKKNRHLSRAISEQGFNNFIQTMKYKCEEYGIEFVQVPMFYPSSKLCSCCGYKNKSLKLKDREWTCPNCGTHHDRDYNAAINLMNYTETQYNS